ncbi:MAG: hypothetical protein JWP97_30 [Labilithrix sp.]|nr:hypothetical protein [Labilithrix sp.]
MRAALATNATASARDNRPSRRRLVLTLATVTLALATAGVLFACSQSPTSVPVRTFERAQRMDVVCLRVYDPPGANQPLNNFVARNAPVGRPEADCAPVPAGIEGESFDRQLFAVVTQSQRGEIAVVDLTAGKLVDQKRAVPGINFLPVGANPTGVAASPDGKMIFVASAETNKPAIYGIPTRRLLGDSPGFTSGAEPANLGSWPVCSLPQNPGAIAVVPRRSGGAGGDAGAGDAGAAGKAATYDIVVVLPGDRLGSAKVLTLDPQPFRRGTLPLWPDGTLDDRADVSGADLETSSVDLVPGAKVLRPGELQPCALVAMESAVELVGAQAVPETFVPGPRWDDGVKYVDGGVDTTCLLPRPEQTCGAAPCCGPVPIHTDDGGTFDPTVPTDGGAEAGSDAAPPAPETCTPAGADAGAKRLDIGPIDPPRLVSFARSEQYAFIADEGAPLVHVLDLSDPLAPRELPPFVATSLAQPNRLVRVKDIAVSPPTRDYKRFLYAIDEADGSLMVFDVTDPLTASRTPMLRPHPELDPFQAIDRINVGGPVVAVSFARHDVPLAQINGVPIPSAASGLLCNPNPNLDPANNGNPLSDLGYYYRANSSDPGQAIGPRRLRGIFGFATLSTGSVAIIDVDDWDSPCRRPNLLDHAISDITPPQPDLHDTDPYHAPTASELSTTNEAFFPISVPHAQRSSLVITNDDVSGNNLPRLFSAPVVSANGVILSQSGEGSEGTPVLTGPTISFAVPQVHQSQDWGFVYEGALPKLEGVSALLDTTDNYASITFTADQAHFCGKGVEDWARGRDRVHAANAELARPRPQLPAGTTLPAILDRQTTDYVQLNEDLLGVDDDYWKLNQSCWEGTLQNASGPARHDFCDGVFGQFASDQKPARDFPIIEAYDDKLRVGRFYTPADAPPSRGREVVYADPTNAADLKLMQCCFHRQAKFNVRAAKQWVAIGHVPGTASNGVGFLSHLQPDSAGRCVSTCDPKDALLNGRLLTTPANVPAYTVDIDSVLALRNPFFQVIIGAAPNGAEPVRDTLYSLPIRGGFAPLVVDTGGGSISVNPQSMRFIDSLGQMAVVDGASQGLVLIDLQTVSVARAPYF